MGFDTNRYLSWYVPLLMKAKEAVNLHSSGAPAFDFDEIEEDTLGSPWDRLPRLEGRLAGWLGVPRDEICMASGATGGTLHALLTLALKGDGFLVESPIYEPMLRQAERLGESTRFKCVMGEGWKLPLLKIEKGLAPGVRIVMITEPINPSGKVRQREQILALADLAAQKGAILLINEVYRGYTDGKSFHGERENILVVSSFSKLLGFYGLRFGWLSGNTEIISKLRSAAMNMSMLHQKLASVGLAMFSRVDEMRADIRAISAAGTETVDQWVGVTDGVSWTKPDGPGFGCVELPKRFADDVAFTGRLFENQGVLVVPGTFFEVPGTIRISWLQSEGRLEEGLAGIAREVGG